MRNTGLIIGIAVLVLLVLLLGAGFGMMGFGMMRSGFPGGGMMPGYAFAPLGWGVSLLFWALVIAGIVFIVLSLARSPRAAPPSMPRTGETPLDILKMRYAKGEITKEQYDQMRQDLGA